MTFLRRPDDEGRGVQGPAGPHPRSGATLGTVIGRDAVLEGTLRGSDPVRINGTLRGRLEAEAPVIVEQGARLEGIVVVPELVVAGSIDGEIECQGRCVVRASALVKGSVRATALRIEDGAWLDGQFHMRPVDEPLATTDADGPARPSRLSSNLPPASSPRGEAPRRRAAAPEARAVKEAAKTSDPRENDELNRGEAARPRAVGE